MALTDKLTAIGNAIRTKTGKADKITLSEMPEEIEGIETGGGFPNGTEWSKPTQWFSRMVAVAHGGSVWVASSGLNGIKYSVDGKTWAESNIKAKGYTITYGDGLWVAGYKENNDNANGLWYSTNGMQWDQSNVTQGAFHSITYANGVWIAASDPYQSKSQQFNGQGLFYSTDGKEWERDSTFDRTRLHVINAKGLWIRAGQRYKDVHYKSGLSFSIDGKTWSEATGLDSESFRSIAFGNGVFIACDGENEYTSTDGKVWTANTTSLGLWNVAYGNGIWVGFRPKEAYYSEDGKEWTKGKVNGKTSVKSNNTLFDVTCDVMVPANGVWVASDTKIITGPIWYSTDGKTWFDSNVTEDGCAGVCYADGIWVAASYYLYYSVAWEPSA